jgi:hypothetical protein
MTDEENGPRRMIYRPAPPPLARTGTKLWNVAMYDPGGILRIESYELLEFTQSELALYQALLLRVLVERKLRP